MNDIYRESVNIIQACLVCVLMLVSSVGFGDVKTLNKSTLTVATFNVSMEATNYVQEHTTVQEHTAAQNRTAQLSADILAKQLATGSNLQIKNIAAIIQTVRPDIILLNEFDVIENRKSGIEAFINNYLKVGQHNRKPIDYPYYYSSDVNTGVLTSFDLDNNGRSGESPGDAYGFGHFPGHYGMVLLSSFPIQQELIRTFQTFLWSDMPGAIRPRLPGNGEYWYSDKEWSQLRLSSKSHWDIPVDVNGTQIHILASHPTPPVFDGLEDRNGARNHDEIRFWRDYLSPENSGYIYDDNKLKGGLDNNARFVILGDLNASMVEGDALHKGIGNLLTHPRVDNTFIPESLGGREKKPDNDNAATHTASWGMRADYVLPSKYGFKTLEGGVYWPIKSEADHQLIASRKNSSDHRLVWLELQILP